MRPGAADRALALKELRVLLPVWSAALVTIAAGFVSTDPRILVAGLLAYGVGTVALGALSVGHEYGYRTVGVLLSQPIARTRILLVKFAVLTPLLLTLAAAAWNAPFTTAGLQRLSGWRHEALLFVPAVLALLVAPWLTMVSRSALAGVVFACSLPGVLMVCGELAGIARFGIGHPGVDPFRAYFWLWGMSAVSAFGAVLTCRGFLRLQALDGTGSDLRMPDWFRTPDRPPARHPVWLLVSKELHLQQMTFVIVVLYAIGWSVLSLLKDSVPAFADAPLVPVTLIYLVLLAVVIGSLASAEERQLGVIEWQMLLPVPAWQQWVVKAGMAIGLALLLGVGLPALLNYVSPGSDHFDLSEMWRANAMIVVVLTVLSLYVSSLSTSGLRAMLGAFPIGVAGLVLVQWMLGMLVHPSAVVVVAFQATLIAVALLLAFRNHRSADRSLRRIAAQALVLLAVPAAGVLMFAGVTIVRLALGR